MRADRTNETDKSLSRATTLTFNRDVYMSMHTCRAAAACGAAITAFMLCGFVPSNIAHAPDDACTLLTQAQAAGSKCGATHRAKPARSSSRRNAAAPCGSANSLRHSCRTGAAGALRPAGAQHWAAV